jgi:ankyrin repeat protein
MSMYDRDWARDSDSDVRFWSSWPRPVRWLVVVLIVLMVVGLIWRNFKRGGFTEYDDQMPPAVLMAIAANDLDALRELAKEDVTLLNQPLGYGGNGTSVFEYLISSSNVPALRSIIESGADVGAKFDGGRTFLHFAARAGNSEVVQLFLDQGADPNATDDLGFTPIFDAAMVEGDKVGVASLLIENGAEVTAVTPDGQTPFYVAEMAKNFRILAVLKRATKP